MFVVTEETLSKLKKSVTIPSRPSILQKLENELAHSDPSLERISDLIAQDVGLSAGILKILNSPAYGLSRKVRDVKHGATILGIEAIKSLSTAYFLKGAFDQTKCCVLLEPFWDVATKVAQATVKIGKVSYCNVPSELMYLAGLFHNCGVPVMAIRYQDYGITMTEAEECEDKTLVEIENEMYDCSHNVVGYFLARNWCLPDPVCKAILHTQDRSLFTFEKDHEIRALVAVMKAAENAVSIIYEGLELTEWRVFQNAALAELELSKQEYANTINVLTAELGS